MTTTITIDPVTRIEGHLKSSLTVASGVVHEAHLAGTMARGFEALLAGRDPRDAVYVTERICGVCFGAHGWTASMAVEQAHGTQELPQAARLLRNLVVGACWLHDHILHFYHLAALDYLNLSVLSDYQGSDTDIQKMKALVGAELAHPPVEGEYAGPLLPSYWTDDAYLLADLDTVVTCVQHYLQALEIQAKAKRASALLAGKQPHQSGIVVGGVTQRPSATTLADFRALLAEQAAFVENVYVSDVLGLAAGPLAQLAASEVGVGYSNYLCYGGFPQHDGSFLFPEGAVLAEQLVMSDRAALEATINEDVTSSWYNASASGHPVSSSQTFDLEQPAAYSFIKAPRLDGNPMEVGPLARMMVALARPDHPAAGHRAVRRFGELLQAGVRPGAVARHAARALETLMLCDAMNEWLDEYEQLPANASIHDTAHWDPPVSGFGVGLSEAPRGALGHWVRIENSVIAHYACVVPTTWNASPRDASAQRGPCEEALIGCPVPDPDNPLNVVRVVRSFDPCIACAVHVLDLTGHRTHRVCMA